MAPHRKLRLIVALAFATAMTAAVFQFNSDDSWRNSLPSETRTTISDAVAIIGIPGYVASIALGGNVHMPLDAVYYPFNFAVWAAIVYLVSMPFIPRIK